MAKQEWGLIRWIMHHLKFHWSMSRKEKVIKLGASGTEESGNWVCRDRIIFIGELEEKDILGRRRKF